MTKWVFYVGGPEAIPNNSIWSTSWDEGEDCLYGFVLALELEARIPRNTYRNADPKVSQYVYGKTGRNHTALLPLEVP